jgi:hypothetical protein
MEIGLERRADKVTAFRRSWPPPSQKLPSIWMMVCAMPEAINSRTIWCVWNQEAGRQEGHMRRSGVVRVITIIECVVMMEDVPIRNVCAKNNCIIHTSCTNTSVI